MRLAATSLTALFLSTLPLQEAQACSCPFLDVVQSYRTHDHAFVGTVTGSRREGSFRLYDVVVRASAKSCVAPGTVVTVSTPLNEAACGVLLPKNQTLVLFGDTKFIRGRPTAFTSLCSGNMLLGDLTADDRAFLGSRELTCDGVSTCADGTAPVSCVVDPCDTSAACNEPDAVCESNYCGGCVPEWYTPWDAATCTPW